MVLCCGWWPLVSTAHLVCPVAVSGNGAVLWLVASRKKMQTVTNIFISLLALGDLLIVLFCMPFSVPSFYITGVSAIFTPNSHSKGITITKLESLVL